MFVGMHPCRAPGCVSCSCAESSAAALESACYLFGKPSLQSPGVQGKKDPIVSDLPLHEVLVTRFLYAIELHNVSQASFERKAHNRFVPIPAGPLSSAAAFDISGAEAQHDRQPPLASLAREDHLWHPRTAVLCQPAALALQSGLHEQHICLVCPHYTHPLQI